MTAPWTAAARDLARAVTRRARLGALLTSCGAGTLVGAAAAWALSPLPSAPPAALPVALGALLGLLHGARRAAHIQPVGLGAAGWALDRVGSAGEAGLASALDGASHAAPPPPRTRLKPVAGLPLALGAALAAGLALALEGRAHDAAARDAGGSALANASAPGGDATTSETGREAGAGRNPNSPAAGPNNAGREQRATEAERVRVALGMTQGSELSAAALAERLHDPTSQAAARRAVAPDSEFAQALASGPEAAAALARVLTQGAQDAVALESERREALADASSTNAPVVGATRRALVERYAALLRAQGGR